MSYLSYPYDGDAIMQKKRALRRELKAKNSLIPIKIAIMSGSTIGEVANILELFLLDSGIAPEIYIGGYGLYYENLVFDDGALARFAPDIIYIHTSNKNILQYPSVDNSAEEVSAMQSAECDRYTAMWQAAAERYNCAIIQNNFEMPSYRPMGNMDAVSTSGKGSYILGLNAHFAAYAREHDNFYINDINYLSAQVGLDNWSSPAVWYAYKYMLDTHNIPLLCQSVSNIIKSLLGKNKKSLILDLDNTLWGGIVGDDGAEGIELGNETPTGMAYAAFQSYIKELSRMGIMLNVCSKNEESAAKSGLERQDSVLKPDDFLVFKANWEPKHINVANIAKELNILPDSFVFVDDNPAERDIVSREISGIATPELTAPEEYIKIIDRSGYFEVTKISDDDKNRNKMYKQNIKRASAQESFGNYEDYLKDLNMSCDIGAFDSEHSQRITQLINKTNQFNLTTRRYTDTEIDTIANSSEYITLYGRLVDKFGDNGIVTAIIGHINGSTLDIDLWVMSCRTFKRHLEYAMFDALTDKCRERKLSTIKGIYLPSAKNLLVSDYYATIGFKHAGDIEPNGKVFTYAISKNESLNKVMKINLL